MGKTGSLLLFLFCFLVHPCQLCGPISAPSGYVFCATQSCETANDQSANRLQTYPHLSLKFDLWIFPKLVGAEYLTRLPCLTQGSCNKTMRHHHHHHHHYLNHQHNDDLRQPHLQLPTMPGVEQGWVRLHGHWCNMSWWLHNGCGWTEVLHFEVKIIRMSC